jgi:hypothetical protein
LKIHLKNRKIAIPWLFVVRKISMESNTFARISARRYRIVDAEERSRFCGLKCMDLNKVKKSKNIRHFPSSKTFF